MLQVRVFVLGGFVLGLVLGLGQPPGTFADETQEHEAEARSFLQDLQAGRFEDIPQRLDDTLKAAVPPEKWKAIWNALETQHGELKELQHARKQETDTHTIVDVNCLFEKTELGLRVTFDAQRKIAGFFVQPAFSKGGSAGEAIALKTSTGELHGEIQLPEGQSPFPVVLFLAGSGPTDRDGNQPGLANDSLKLLGEALASEGFATLRVDKRGVAASSGASPGEEKLRFDDFVRDASGWIELLRKDPRFDQVIVLGHSQGSLVGAIAAQGNPVDALVSVAGAGVPVQELLLRQLRGKFPKELQARAEVILDELAAGRRVDEVPEGLLALFRPTVQPFFISWMKYDPWDEIGKLDIPTLIVQGTTDVQITVEDARRLADSGSHAKLAIVQDMNHVLKECRKPEDQTATYTQPDRPLSPALMPPLIDFLKRAITKQ